MDLAETIIKSMARSLADKLSALDDSRIYFATRWIHSGSPLGYDIVCYPSHWRDLKPKVCVYWDDELITISHTHNGKRIAIDFDPVNPSSDIEDIIAKQLLKLLGYMPM